MPLDSAYLFQFPRFSSLEIWGCAENQNLNLLSCFSSLKLTSCKLSNFQMEGAPCNTRNQEEDFQWYAWTNTRDKLTYSLSEASNVPQFLKILPMVKLPTVYYLAVYSDHNMAKAAVFGLPFTLVQVHANQLEGKKRQATVNFVQKFGFINGVDNVN